MKRKYLLYAVMLILFTACTRNADSLVTPNNAVSATSPWKVIFYWDKKDETSNFAGWTISFLDGGKLTASKGSTVVNGTWAQTSSKFTLSFGGDPVLSDLDGNWQIVSITDSLIKLKDDNPSQDDELHLGK